MKAPCPLAAIVVAAGQGLRAGQPVPKQFAEWRGKPLVRHSVEALRALQNGPIVVVIPAGADALADDALAGIGDVRLVTGGPTRQESVYCGLISIEADAPLNVLIHDAARPRVSALTVERLLEALVRVPAAIPVLPVIDSVIAAAGDTMGQAVRRDPLRRVQTPQAFRFAEIIAAHRAWLGEKTAGDDAQVASATGLEVGLVEGDEIMQKVTFAADFAPLQSPVRTGSGFDVHRLVPDEELWLGGIRIEHSHGLAGHSDADVAIHAIVDALLGAVGAGDIGTHFPPTDPQWQGASSDQFLQHAASLVGQAGYRIGNVDLTIICEAPKIGPHREAMRARLADLMDVDTAAVSVKATTTERLGFAGRGEGIAAQAVATVFRFD